MLPRPWVWGELSSKSSAGRRGFTRGLIIRTNWRKRRLCAHRLFSRRNRCSRYRYLAGSTSCDVLARRWVLPWKQFSFERARNLFRPPRARGRLSPRAASCEPCVRAAPRLPCVAAHLRVVKVKLMMIQSPQVRNSRVCTAHEYAPTIIHMQTHAGHSVQSVHYYATSAHCRPGH